MRLQILNELALKLFNNYAIERDGVLYRIAEAEIYYHSSEFPDPFCHRHEAQESFENSYFHYSGFDVTFGKPGVFIGALIRGIQHDATGEYIYGPGRVAYDWNSTKTKRRIALVKDRSYDYRLSEVGKPYVYDKEILTLPRINLSKATMLKAIRSKNRDEIDVMLEALHLPARYLRLPENFYEYKNKPDDIKSIVSAL